jgi:hypothetical protein
MDLEASEIIVGLMMVIFGLIGLVLGAGAVDDEMYVFGLSLFVFACVFIFGMLRQHYNRRDAARAAARREGASHG